MRGVSRQLGAEMPQLLYYNLSTALSESSSSRKCEPSLSISPLFNPVPILHIYSIV